MNIEIPEITEKEFCENVDFIFDALVVRNKMSLKILTEDGRGVMILPVADKVPTPNNVMIELEELQKQFDSQLSNLNLGAIPPPM